MSGSGISWAICKSAPRSRQISTPAPHHSVFYRPDALPAAQPTASKHWKHIVIYLQHLNKQQFDITLYSLKLQLLRNSAVICDTSLHTKTRVESTLTAVGGRRRPIAARAVALALSWCIWSSSACCSCLITTPKHMDVKQSLLYSCHILAFKNTHTHTHTPI